MTKTKLGKAHMMADYDNIPSSSDIFIYQVTQKIILVCITFVVSN